MKKVEVFSYGGCGTNYLRRLVKVFTPSQQRLLTQKQRRMGIRRRVHQRIPPVDGYDLVIYVYGNPVKSIDSMLYRKKYRTLSILASDMTLVKYSKTNKENTQVLFDKNKNILKLEEHFDNWKTCNRPYDIMFVNYDALNEKKFESLCKALTDNGVSINEKIKTKFKPRKREIREFLKPIKNALLSTHRNLIRKIESTPAFYLRKKNNI